MAYLTLSDLPSSSLPAVAEKEKRYRGIVIPKTEYQLFKEEWKDKPQYHLLVNGFQHQRIQTVQADLFSMFCDNATQGAKQLTFIRADPANFGITTQQEEWFMYSYIKTDTEHELLPSIDHNLYIRCIYWENNTYFYKRGVSMVGLKSMTDDSFARPLEKRSLTLI